MQAHAAEVRHNGTSAYPSSGSAFLAGQIVTVTVPTLELSDGLLAIGDEWIERHLSTDEDRCDEWRVMSNEW